MRHFESGLKALVATLLTACKEQIPASGTDGYNRLHGIINDGKTVNEITLINDRNSTRPTLRFPPEVAVGVETPGTHNPEPVQIQNGYAYVAYMGLEYNNQKRLIPIVKTSNHLVFETVYLRFSASYGSLSQAKETRLQQIVKRSTQIEEKQDLGLREYQPKGPGQGDSFYYVPLDNSFKLPDGEKLLIQCDGIPSPRGYIGTCGTNFRHPSGASVSYRYGGSILPYWREIHEEVYKFTDSVVVQR